ncbi:MAG: B12-binding domain-containing radical SAM protein [Candidatus Aminicenantes bacterium]
MRYKRVLLLNAAYEDNYFDLQPELTTGLGYIAEALKKEGIEYEVMDLDLGYSFEDLVKKIFSFQPDLIGMSLMSLGYRKNYQTLRKIKRKFPPVDIVVGGPHVSTLKEEVLAECGEVDFGVVGEGELAMVELCKGEKPESIKGLLFRKHGEIVYTGDRAFLMDLDSLEFPRYEKFDMDKYREIRRDRRQSIPVLTSRGCPFSCTFCAAYLSIGKRFRYRSASHVVDEIHYWSEKGHKDFLINDDNFTLRKDRVHEICGEIEKRKLAGLSFACNTGVRADRVDRDILKKMKAVGFWRLTFGVEAGNNRILRNIKKGERIETIERAIREACQEGFVVELSFLLGSPGETWPDIQDGFDLALRYPIAVVEWSHIVPYPKTELYCWLRERGYLSSGWRDFLNVGSRRRNHPLFYTPELSFEQRKKAWKRSRRVMKTVTIRATKRKLEKLGVLGKILAYVYGNFLLRNVLVGNEMVRKIAVDPVKKLAKISK